MFARVSTLQGPTEGVDGLMREAEENVIPSVKQLDGYKGFLLLADRGSGGVVALTFWDTEDSMRASEEAANKLRDQAATAGSEQIVGVERYEVLIDQTP